MCYIRNCVGVVLSRFGVWSLLMIRENGKQLTSLFSILQTRPFVMDSLVLLVIHQVSQSLHLAKIVATGTQLVLQYAMHVWMGLRL